MAVNSDSTRRAETAPDLHFTDHAKLSFPFVLVVLKEERLE